MPLLEAPAEYLESSPEHSLQPEIPLLMAAPGPAALAQLRLPELRVDVAPAPPAPRHNRHLLMRHNSIYRDVPMTEEEQHFPAFVHLLPVVLPTQAPEPTLDELLRRVTQRNDLEHVETVRLRVISYTVSLSRLSLFLPRLQQLDLSGSVLSSLRDLGFGLLQLTQLNISNCGLNSFDGTSGLPALRVLLADGNMIQRVGPLSELLQLQRLSARNNRISELGLLSFLGMCPQLLEVELRGNPVCRLAMYRATLQRSVPTLQLLDGQPLIAPPAAISADEEEHSSLSSDESLAQRRPVTAPQHNQTNDDSMPAPLRPATAAVLVARRQAALPTAPVAGSVLGLVRQRRRRADHAWVSFSSSSSASSNYSSAAGTPAASLSSCSSHNSLDASSSSACYAFNAQSTFN